jgi:hypothetical protein
VSSIVIPRLIHHRGQARNGCYPASGFVRRLVDAENHLTAYAHRQVFAKTWPMGVAQLNTTSQVIARWRFRAGHGATRLSVLLLLGGSDANGVFIQPAAYADITISGGATSTIGPLIAPILEAAATDVPDELLMLEGSVALTPGTVYECALRVTGYAVTGSTSNEAARVLAACAYELGNPTIDESTNYYNTHQPTAGSLIYDADRERLLVGLSNMYRQNGAINCHWSLTDGVARTRSSATQVNLIDNTTTGTPTAGTHPGWYIDPRYHRTASRTTVPFEWAVYASMSAGSGTCRLIDTVGNTYGTITVNSATPQWWAATFSLAESAEIYIVPQFAGDGAGTLSVYAASAIEWES